MSLIVVLPETGVDVGGIVSGADLVLGGVVLLVVGGYFAFLVVRKVVEWSRIF